MKIESKLYTRAEVESFIKQGKVLGLCGHPTLLINLPKGNWIAGTCPYFVDGEGIICDDKIYVDDFTDICKSVELKTFDETNIKDIAKKDFNGFILMVIPVDSPTMEEYTTHSMEYENLFINPVVGYIAATTIERHGKEKTYCGIGATCELSSQKAAVMYVELHEGYTAKSEVIYLDTPDTNGPVIEFPKTGVVQSDCLLDGKPGNIADYLSTMGRQGSHYCDLVANLGGATVCKGIKYVDHVSREVGFFNPPFVGDKYHVAKADVDYVEEFNKIIDKKRKETNLCFYVGCASYYLGGNLTGKKINMNGFFGFGEIVYQIVNKTFVTLEIDKTE
ncbi:MAG: hypothetical protein MJZ61_04005 [Bacteroidales bacterium]|nr:hypothetical protein [Bacteroidales bacterium]